MYKENGRLTSTDKKEESKSSGKLFKCDVCNNTVYVTGVEFVETNACPECGGTMSEHLEYFD